MTSVTKEALQEEIAFRVKTMEDLPTPQNIPTQTFFERMAFIEGLKRALEMADQPEFQPEPINFLEPMTDYAERGTQLETAKEIIGWYLDDHLARNEQDYTRSDWVAYCDDWFKWVDGELEPEAIKEEFNFPPKKI